MLLFWSNQKSSVMSVVQLKIMTRDEIKIFEDNLYKIQSRVAELNKHNISLVESLIESRRIEVQHEDCNH